MARYKHFEAAVVSTLIRYVAYRQEQRSFNFVRSRRSEGPSAEVASAALVPGWSRGHCERDRNLELSEFCGSPSLVNHKFGTKVPSQPETDALASREIWLEVERAPKKNWPSTVGAASNR
jgi:hypothetical protein